MKQVSFTDFDEFAASVREVDCKMAVQCPVFHNWSLKIAEAGEVEVQFGRLGTGNVLEGKSWKYGVLVYLPLTPDTRYAANGETIELDAFMVMEPDCHFDLSSNGVHDWCTVFVPRVRFHDLAWDQPRSYTTRADPALANRVKSLVSQVLEASKNSELFSCSAAARHAESALIDVTAQVVALPGKGNDRSRAGRTKHGKLVRSARKHISSTRYDMLRVDEMAEVLGISERALRYMFQEYFSASPKKIIEAFTIRSIRNDLLAADPNERSVTNIVMDHGIYELGRFAARYRRLYGEQPSETLRRPASHIASEPS